MEIDELTPVLRGHGEQVALARAVEAGLYAAAVLAGTERQRVPATTEELAAVAAEGERAMAVLVADHIGLVKAMAHQRAPRSDLDYDDLLQDGLVAMIEALRRWDHRSGSYAAAYVEVCVDGAMRCNRAGHLSLAGRRRTSRLGKARRVLTDMLGREPSLAELAQAVGRSEAWVTEVWAAGLPPRDIADTDERPTAASDPTPDLEAWLATLPELQQRVLRDRFGLGGEEPMPLRQVAARHGMSQSRIRRLEAAALTRLRSRLHHTAA
ncbi:sigma-70 family RNA polymerase sigma factor [Parenemella sanctibonifatiensis]|uniref:Sigma-70 family RNA polymerase sigma factor n=1 Tax=Parenemella sanctibonifatiensis TaxID=2016505 RepID=A0A255E1A7_9ACTN|nr:sigma-70 family RNA polymerase sigma factor [Parenemella sanctibonifatiensis]OYN85324.1 hypothetical protein CGZ92_11020 [Parenemella sanctibonifatiensis]